DVQASATRGTRRRERERERGTSMEVRRRTLATGLSAARRKARFLQRRASCRRQRRKGRRYTSFDRAPNDVGATVRMPLSNRPTRGHAYFGHVHQEEG